MVLDSEPAPASPTSTASTDSSTASASTDEAFAPQVDALIGGIARLNTAALEVIRERPVACLVGAVTLGFLVGKIAARH
jgi:hypothetical protein